MKIAVVSDDLYPIHQVVIQWLKEHGYEPCLFGALKSQKTADSWVLPISEAALAIQSGRCEEGIFFCWTGTGASIIANKVPGIRAALCADAATTRAARVWNHANVLALSNRLLSQDVAKEVLEAWFETYDRDKGARGVAELQDFERARSLKS